MSKETPPFYIQTIAAAAIPDPVYPGADGDLHLRRGFLRRGDLRPQAVVKIIGDPDAVMTETVAYEGQEYKVYLLAVICTSG